VSSIEPAEHAAEYDVIRATGLVDDLDGVITVLKDMVNTAMSAGYDPTGGVAACVGPSDAGPSVTLLQATVRYQD
jgi:hypothetical protein